jgi:hypothetical protein
MSNESKETYSVHSQVDTKKLAITASFLFVPTIQHKGDLANARIRGIRMSFGFVKPTNYIISMTFSEAGGSILSLVHSLTIVSRSDVL